MTENIEYRCNQCRERIQGEGISYAEVKLLGRVEYSIYHPLSRKIDGSSAPNCISTESLGLWHAHVSSCNSTLINGTKEELTARIIEQTKQRMKI